MIGLQKRVGLLALQIGVGLRQFHCSSHADRLFKHVVSRRVKQEPAPKTSFWVKQHLKTGRKVKYPPYPYGDATLFKRSNFGLYGGRMPQTGHQISEAENKFKRTWKPNVLVKSYVSHTLQKQIRLRVAAGVIKTIKREGGLDQYLTKEKAARIKEIGPRGWRLRYAILLRQEEMNKRRERLRALRRKNCART